MLYFLIAQGFFRQGNVLGVIMDLTSSVVIISSFYLHLIYNARSADLRLSTSEQIHSKVAQLQL